MVRVEKYRFKAMYKIRGYSEKKLGLQLEKLPESDPAHRSYRTLQRNLENGEMDYEVLEKCAELLDCSPDYLRGVNNAATTKKYWDKSYEYLRIMEILDDYWLTEPEEKEVSVEMHFLKANGERQDKLITWCNPNMEHEYNFEIVNLADALRELEQEESEG